MSIRCGASVETSNADQNGHETLVKVGRIVPRTSAGLVLPGPTVDTSLCCHVFVDPGHFVPDLLLVHKIGCVMLMDLPFLGAGRPRTTKTGTLASVVVPRRSEGLVGIPIDFGDKGDTNSRFPHGLGVRGIMGGR